MHNCFCGSGQEYISCCGQYIETEKQAPYPEALMRSRYSAYAQGNIEYIARTMRGKAAQGFSVESAQSWTNAVRWLSLQVLDAGIEPSGMGVVEFIAQYIQGDKLYLMHERSQFEHDHGRWYYVDGIQIPEAASGKEIARNQPCPCRKGKKFKNCHGKA
ncbi:MAG: YchJ family metal-binding protein [Legionellaceae bacterium]|nr:YchJ family metal-binding protein [Legionellaceae bacterium]